MKNYMRACHHTFNVLQKFFESSDKKIRQNVYLGGTKQTNVYD